MDAGVGSPSSKRLVLSGNRGIDIISSLPDDILHHILSFVSTKDATPTSILSTRWLNLRTSSPSIVLIDDPSSSTKIRSEAVSRILTCHDSSDIKSLVLLLSAPVDLSHLDLWLSVAKVHNVQKLDLNLRTDDQFELPKRLYDCRSLVELKLSVKCVLKAPKCSQFSGLTSLQLSEITFHDRLSFLRLFANCPFLEELALVNCEWRNIKSVFVVMPMLSSLTLWQDFATGDVLECFVVFSTPNLSSFNCSSDLTVNFDLHVQSSLERASLDVICEREYMGVLSPRALRLFNGLQYVKFLSISNEIFLCLLFVHVHWLNLRPFENLMHLEVITEYNMVLSDVFLFFLYKAPKLEFLHLTKGVVPNPEFTWDLSDAIVFPSCFNACLKRICVANFEARPEEMELLKFLLKNVTVLERMLIYFSAKMLMDTEKLEEVRNRLETLPRGSESFVIELH